MTTQLQLDGEDEAVLVDLVHDTGRDAMSIVRDALREERDRVDREQRATFPLAELKVILERLKPSPGEATYMGHREGDAWLYDENGLPH